MKYTLIRYTLLCGVFAHQYKAQLISQIDSRITNRQIIMAGGLHDITKNGNPNDDGCDDGDHGDGDGNKLTPVKVGINRGTNRLVMPKLLFS